MPDYISLISRASNHFHLQSIKLPILLGLICFFVYNANLRQIGAGDTLPARYLPLILWHNGTFDFAASTRLVAHGHSTVPDWSRPAISGGKTNYFEPWAYWLVRTRENQLASLYPVVTPLLVAPLYLPAVIWLDANGWEQPQIDRIAELMEKISASILASLASVLMFLVLRREGSLWSLPLTAVFAFGTNTWMISSQALWQHGTGELLIALALLLITSAFSPARTALLGAVCVFMAANRPPDALIAGVIILFIIWSRRRRSVWLLAGIAVPLAALLYYNLNFIGHLAGGYALAKPHNNNFFQLDWSGIPGLFISPTRGLFVFSPFLVFIFVGLKQRLQSPNSRGLAAALSFAAIVQVLLYSQADWRAGVSWGPRWLTDLLPILIWLLAPAPLVLRPRARGLLILTMMISVGVQMIGAFWYTKTSDELIFAGNPSSMRGAWDPQNVPFLVELRHSRAQGELRCSAEGMIDRIGMTRLSGTGEIPVIKSGTVLEGWTLACGRSPAHLLVLVDGIIIGSVTNFSPRADVSAKMRIVSPSGWHISADARGISPGDHTLQLAVRIQPGSDFRIVREQRVIIIEDEFSADRSLTSQNQISTIDLDRAAVHASLLLQERQSVEGYWLTSHTRELRYENPQPEMNTFLTSMLVDLLSPVSSKLSLDDQVARARQHLGAQIESNGLVRYHGLPNGPAIGTLGCAITPDADNTALAWRIANPGLGDQRLPQMLTEITRFRDAKGLYRTWLASQDQYRCLDPGSNPNPTDVAIQMHVFMMLREFDPPAAKKLCSALKRSFGDDNIWVYYAKAPLLPYLRSVELKKLGCEVPPPTNRLGRNLTDQEIWSEAGRLLAKTMESPPNATTRQAIRNLLVRIGNDDFAMLRRTPPLLYHNDLSATVKRFYWSEDFGYAIWLRLYEETETKSK